jgi:hypothetical protein
VHTGIHDQADARAPLVRNTYRATVNAIQPQSGLS